MSSFTNSSGYPHTHLKVRSQLMQLTSVRKGCNFFWIYKVISDKLKEIPIWFNDFIWKMQKEINFTKLLQPQECYVCCTNCLLDTHKLLILRHQSVIIYCSVIDESSDWNSFYLVYTRNIGPLHQWSIKNLKAFWFLFSQGITHQALTPIFISAALLHKDSGEFCHHYVIKDSRAWISCCTCWDCLWTCWMSW